VDAAVARSAFPSQNVQSTPTSEHLWKLRCPEVDAAVARSTFPSQNVQSTPTSEHLSKLQCRKVDATVWPEAHFQVKMYKAHQLRSTSGSCDVEKVDTILARSTFPSQNVKMYKHQMLGSLLKVQMWFFAWQVQGILHFVESEQNVRVLWHFQKRWQAWDMWRRPGKMHVT